MSELAEEREKKTDVPGDPSSDQASQEVPVEDADRAAEGDLVSKEDKDSEEQQTQDEPDDPLMPPMPPSYVLSPVKSYAFLTRINSLVYKGRPSGPTAGGAGNRPRPKPGLR